VRQFTARMRAPLSPGIERELLDLRTTDGRVQVVMQAGTTAVLAEEGGAQVLQVTGTNRLETTGLLVPAVEQTVEILLDVTFAAAHGLGVAEQKQNARRGMQLMACDATQQAIQQ